MRIAGSRRILAPRHRVWNALQNPDLLQNFVTGADGASSQVSQARPDHMVSVQFTRGRADFRLTEDGVLGTLLAYDVEMETTDEQRLRNRLEEFLTAFQAEVATAPELAADGITGALAATMRPAHPFRAMPNGVLGLPLVFWAGSAVFLLIFGFMFSAYL